VKIGVGQHILSGDTAVAMTSVEVGGKKCETRGVIGSCALGPWLHIYFRARPSVLSGTPVRADFFPDLNRFFIDAGKAIEKGTHDAGNAIEKGTHHTGNALEQAAHDAGDSIEKGAHDTGHTLEKASQDTGKFAKDHPVEFALIAAAIGGGAYLAFAPNALLTITLNKVPVLVIEGTKTSGVIAAGVSEAAGGATAYLVSQRDLKERTATASGGGPNVISVTAELQPHQLDTLAADPNRPADRGEAVSKAPPSSVQTPKANAALQAGPVNRTKTEEVLAAMARADFALKAASSASTPDQRLDAMARICAAIDAISKLPPSEADRQVAEYWDDKKNFPKDLIELFEKGLLDKALFLSKLLIEPHPLNDGTFASEINREQMLAVLRKENDRQALLYLGVPDIGRLLGSPVQDRIKAMSEELLRRQPNQNAIDVPRL
jgi:hypothetical protein